MDNSPNYTGVLNKGLRLFFSELLRVSLRHPSQALHFLRVVNWQRSAARLRARQANRDAVRAMMNTTPQT